MLDMLTAPRVAMLGPDTLKAPAWPSQGPAVATSGPCHGLLAMLSPLLATSWPHLSLLRVPFVKTTMFCEMRFPRLSFQTIYTSEQLLGMGKHSFLNLQVECY